MAPSLSPKKERVAKKSPKESFSSPRKSPASNRTPTSKQNLIGEETLCCTSTREEPLCAPQNGQKKGQDKPSAATQLFSQKDLFEKVFSNIPLTSINRIRWLLSLQRVSRDFNKHINEIKALRKALFFDLTVTSPRKGRGRPRHPTPNPLFDNFNMFLPVGANLKIYRAMPDENWIRRMKPKLGKWKVVDDNEEFDWKGRKRAVVESWRKMHLYDCKYDVVRLVPRGWGSGFGYESQTLESPTAGKVWEESWETFG